MHDLEQHYNQRATELDEIAATYLHTSAYKRWFYQTRFEAVMRALAPNPDQKILEVGSGSGYYSKAIAAISPHLTATEYAQNYLEATKRFNPHPVDAYVHCSATELPFPDDAFDSILCTEVIEHIPEWAKALDEIARVLRPGGQAVITTPNKYSYMNIAYYLKRWIRRYSFNEHVHEFSIPEFRRELQKRFTLTSLSFSNYLICYPFDSHWTTHSPSEKTVRVLDRIEQSLRKMPVLRNIGWTMIATVRKS